MNLQVARNCGETGMGAGWNFPTCGLPMTNPSATAIMSTSTIAFLYLYCLYIPLKTTEEFREDFTPHIPLTSQLKFNSP